MTTHTKLLASGLALLCVHLTLNLPAALGQGLELAKGGLGSTYKTEAILGQRYARVKSVRLNYKSLKNTGGLTPTKCGKNTGALCASNLAEDQQLLQMAASPDVFDARTAFPAKVISPPGDQGKCNSCVGFAVEAAASAAVATALQIDGTKVQLSVQDLQFCSRSGSSATPARTCRSSWQYVAALNRLTQTPQPVAQSCLPYTAANDVKFSQLCNYCSLSVTKQVNEYAAAGSFISEPIADLVEVQKSIRTYGGVLTAINVDITHMRMFFSSQPKGIYAGNQTTGSDGFEGHAIFVVGYSNRGRYWIAKNSFGQDFADGGFMRIAYGSSGIMPTDNTFVVMWAPGPGSPRQQPPLPVTKDPSRPGCFRYTAQRTDFLSR
jgi:C1A family cysteine protease